jgi:hypothetical protein
LLQNGQTDKQLKKTAGGQFSRTAGKHMAQTTSADICLQAAESLNPAKYTNKNLFKKRPAFYLLIIY